jgi:2-C-methyl-D-erythritol 4-phosphate cytidylyltransferase
MSIQSKYYAIITAGGSGTRMGSMVPKQFLELAGKPILLRTLELFTELDREVEMILVLPPRYIKNWQDYCVKNQLWFKHVIVEGGLTRFHSVKAALEFVPDNAVVAVHDGVRPFVPRELVQEMLDYDFSEKYAGIIPILPMVDSMREKILDSEGEMIGSRPVPRDNYFIVQTPQVFDSTRLKRAYKKPYSPTFTDDATVIESAGYSVDTCEGSRLNLKITTPEDLKEANIIYASL